MAAFNQKWKRHNDDLSLCLVAMKFQQLYPCLWAGQHDQTTVETARRVDLWGIEDGGLLLGVVMTSLGYMRVKNRIDKRWCMVSCMNLSLN